jgi:septal ring factor EnvC (AmiA/AmiB activator)
MSEQISSFEDQIKRLSLVSGRENFNGTSNNHSSKENKLEDLEEQVKTLSTQLLRKQGAVQELQSERSALKSRLTDMQSRAAKAEQQLMQLKDAEDEGELYYEGGNSSLRRKGLAPGVFDDDAKGKVKGHKVLSGLEQIGVRIKSAPVTSFEIFCDFCNISLLYFVDRALQRLLIL